MAELSKNEYKNVAQYLASGIGIVTIRSGSEINGMTATAICSASLEPPLFLVCISKGWRTHEFISTEKIFSVNFLAEGQQEISELFGNPNPRKVEQLSAISRPSPTNGCPVIEGCLGYIDCEAVSIYDAADHSIFLGKVTAGEVLSKAKPLLHFTGNYYTIS